MSDIVPKAQFRRAEWRSVREALGTGLLADLIGVSATSLRRYASGERTAPHLVDQRLRWVAAVADDLAGSYDELGLKKWFDRARPQLRGKSPRQFLKANWTPESTEALKVRELSAALLGSHRIEP